uniref:Uncharacterized protein n=1 Tax=Solanum tuberosum TaxID=4113 RepID=M1D6W7_SOLTU
MKQAFYGNWKVPSLLFGSCTQKVNNLIFWYLLTNQKNDNSKQRNVQLDLSYWWRWTDSRFSLREIKK